MMISEGSRRVADIIRRLLTFARQTKPLKTTVNLNEIIDNTLKLRAYYLKTNDIELITKFDPELPLSVVDPGQLQQVFVNLIVNAEQAMKKAHGKGTLTVTTEKQENSIRITFRDDGPGISKETMGRVFEPFYTTKEPGEGTGLGLSLSRSIILEHNGRMTVESEPGHGAMFIIDLPVYNTLPPEGGAPVSASAEKISPKKQLRILVVDDESSVRYVLDRVLKHLNYSVDTIADAKTALEKIAAGETYDVILTDIRMPGMNGIEMYSYILEKSPSMANKTIFVTGDVMGTDVREFLVRYNLPYLSKPFHVRAVKDKIDDVLHIKHGENGNSAQNAG
jgi:CheY-like chemotaxis protein